MNRDTFLQRVRQAVARGNAFQVATREVPENVGYVGAGTDCIARLVDEVTQVGGVVHRCENIVAARQAVELLLREHCPHSALCWEHPLLDQIALDTLLAEQGIEQISHRVLAALPPQERRAKMLATSVGISSADYAIAETGTLAVFAQPGQERVASLLPPLYVSVIHRDQILPDLLDLFERLHVAGLESLPSNVTLITGPSKTGDIELQLTTGVHGPGRWHVILIG